MLPRTIFTLVVLFLSRGIIAAPPAIPAESGDGGASVDSTVSERFPDLSLPAPGVLSFVPPIKPEVWNDAERAVIKECASGASDEDVALWRLPRDGWVVVATADERLCVCAPHDGKPVLVAMHRIDFGGGSLRGVAGPGIDVGDLDGNGTLDMIFHWGSGGCGLAANIGNDTVVLLEPAIPGAAALVRFLPLGSHYGMHPLDIDRNGRIEFLVAQFARCEMCTDGKPHNFWVWELVGIQGGRLVDLNATVPDFPRFEWLSFAPEDRWRTLLTPAMKRKLRGGGLGFEPYRKGAKG